MLHLLVNRYYTAIITEKITKIKIHVAWLKTLIGSIGNQLGN